MSLDPHAEHYLREDRIQTPAGGQVVRQVRSETRIPTEAERRLAALERARSVGLWLLTLVSGLILFRFALKLFGANPDNAFADFIYRASYPLVAPFLTLFGYNPSLGRSVLEFPDLFAVAAYALAFWAIFSLTRIIFAPDDPTGRAYR